MLLFAWMLLFISVASAQEPVPAFSPAADAFDAKRAWEHLITQCNFGPRVAGERGHRLCRDYIVEQLKSNGCTVELQEFSAFIPLINDERRFTNIIAKIDTPSTQAVAISCHWDTRPIADYDRIPSLRDTPISGANDGASGVAVLLEAARVFKHHPPPFDVYLLFFDAEDLGRNRQKKEWALGSQYFAKHMPDDFQIICGFNLDMIGDKDQRFLYEKKSLELAGKWTRAFWRLGQRHYPQCFSDATINEIVDDHAPFLAKGVPYFDVIDFDYDAWHTTQDIPASCSAASLSRIGKITVEYVMQTLPQLCEKVENP